jgi:FSR family fosmidomycin resistance protein-like MFS transporter
MLALVGAQTGYFWLLFIPFVMRALGSGAFHPVGTMHAADSDPTRSASNLSYFFLMGQFGLALGPALAGLLLDAANTNTQHLYTNVFTPLYDMSIQWNGTVSPLFALVILAFPAVSFMLWVLPTAQHYRSEQQTLAETQVKSVAAVIPWRAFALLGLMVGLRSLAQPGSVTFIPVLFQNKGWTPAEYGAITSSFWLASGISGVVFGNLADRYDRRWIVTLSLMSAAPAFFLLPLVNGPLAFATAVIAGGLSGGSHSIIVVLAQDLIPAAKGFASGTILGFTFGMGALGSFSIGTVSDIIGLGTTFQVVAGLIVVASFLALLLPAKATPAPVEEVNPAGAV